MSSWRAFPEGAWRAVAAASLSGFGKGEGSYGLAYAIDTTVGPFLNGRVSARFQLAEGRPIAGAGVIARADTLRSFATCYVLSDDRLRDHYSLRLAAFKLGKLEALVGLKQSVPLPDRLFQISLQCYSGELVGQVVAEGETFTLKYILPESPFPGYCGVIRFYSASAMASNLHVEEIGMRPILPEESADRQREAHSYCVFLSHSSADKPTVMKVVEALKKNGISYWIDSEQLTFGDGIIAKIESGLKKSKFVVVCLSDNLEKSGWCRAEYGPILYREFSGQTSRRVIPLSLDGSKDIDAVPLLLSDKVRADFTEATSFGALLEFLRQAMASL